MPIAVQLMKREHRFPQGLPEHGAGALTALIFVGTYTETAHC